LGSQPGFVDQDANIDKDWRQGVPPSDGFERPGYGQQGYTGYGGDDNMRGGYGGRSGDIDMMERDRDRYAFFY
jgi:hypothetical protein